MGVRSIRTIGSWERGETIPQNLNALEEVLDIDLTGRQRLVVTVPEVREDIVVTIPVRGSLTAEGRRAAEAAARGAAEAVIAIESGDSGTNGS